MPDISRSAVVPHSAAQMYDLVNAVEDYPVFLPWCRSSEVLSRDEDEVRATLCLAKGAISKTFTTCNRLQKHKIIEIRLVDGPFDHLEGFWRFDNLDEPANHSRICLDLEFRFAGKLVSLAFGPVFHQIADKLVDSFSDRAKAVYGSGETQ